MLADLPFHPKIGQWFRDCVGTPTEVQTASWPIIASGGHALVTAPTGSGKTLTAFLWSLSQFATGDLVTGRTQVLYISPLKALNNDIQRNLLSPLATLRHAYGLPEVRVETRSGDTSASDRQRLLRHPPDILITTPESLALMLTTQKGRQALAHIETLILDEIHSIVDNRRGAHLLTNVERLVDLAGEFQRIALSATVSPLAAVADYIAGSDRNGQHRHVEIVNVPGEKEIDFRVRFPEAARTAAENGKKIWEPLSETFREVIDGNESTLFFTNSRRLAEKITLKINEPSHEPVAYAHHGSLAREVRTEVESRLKAGELKAIVATNTLEMGIDIGHLDEVVMVQSPPSVAATLQRVGRAGHGVGEVSVGTLYPSHAQDMLEAAVLADAVNDRDIEPLALMRAPLDVLAQIIISICATDAQPVDEVYRLITRASPYRDLKREHFDLVVEMLSGRYAGSRIRELKPRLEHDRIHHTIKANRGAVLAMYNSGGTIPDRGYYQMKHFETGATLGELDEEFVWEATVGQTLTLGTKNWQVHRITHNDVLVRPGRPDAAAPPFWRSEFFNRSYHFSNRITQYLEMAEETLAGGDAESLQTQLEGGSHFDTSAATELVDYLKQQRAHTETPLPHRHHLLLELVNAGPAGYRGPNQPRQLVLHTYWGGRLNRPWALAFKTAWQERFGYKPEIHADNDAIVLQVKEPPDPHELLSLVRPDRVPDLIRQSLESSGFFGARFRECAGRALLLTKQRFNQRLPLWMSRLQAKKLMTQVKAFSEFPVLLETWRTCLDDEFDIPALMDRLTEIQDGTITWSYATTETPSPFARNLTFGQVSRYMYADDTPDDDTTSKLSTDLITEALYNQALRPRIRADIVAEFLAKRQRRAAGYAPESPEEWAEWLKERVLLPAAELPDDAALPAEAVWIEQDGRRWLTHLELVHGLRASGFVSAGPEAPVVEDARDAVQLAREMLSFYGPMSDAEIAAVLPSIPEDLLVEDELFIHGVLLEGDDRALWCDAENFEALMRFQRAAQRAELEPLAAEQLPPFWSAWQRFGDRGDDNALLYAIETLRGCNAPLTTWLHDLLPARLADFQAHRWDELFTNFGFSWLGTGRETVTVVYPEEVSLYRNAAKPPAFADDFADPNASYTFQQIADGSALDRESLNAEWWQAVWQGQLVSDTLKPLEQGLERKYSVPDLATAASSRRRLARAPLGWSGHWRLLAPEALPDPLTRLENDKEKVRQLLDRYGFVCREIVNRENLAREGSSWRWRDAFRALRIMELAGEVTTGQFFLGLSTPQFISPRALSALQTNSPSPNHFWMAAHDPISPCGLSLDWEDLPQRRLGNFMSFADGTLALVVENHGKDLTYHVPWDHPEMDQINAVLLHLTATRRQRVTLQTINGEPATRSPYLAGLDRLFTVSRDHKACYLETRF